MRKIVIMIGAMLLMSCSMNREEEAFERYMDDLFIEVSNIPIAEFNFEAEALERLPYTMADRDIAELADIVATVDKGMGWEVIFMDEVTGKLDMAMENINKSYDDLKRWVSCNKKLYEMADDSVVVIYNRNREMVGMAIDDLVEVAKQSNLESSTITKLEECRERLMALPEEWVMRDVKRIGNAIEFRYEMDVDEYRKVFNTWAVYDEEKGEIVRLDEDGLPLGVMLKLGIRNIFN